MKKTLALCVGINDFPNLAGSNLSGCLHDADSMSRFFHVYYDGVACSVYLDNVAKKNNIVSSLNSMVNAAIADKNVSQILFSVSSHGTQVRDMDGDEPDGVDEAIVCHDSRKRGIGIDPASLITDDELYTIFSRVPKNVIVEVWLDMCFSGTGLKKVNTKTIRPRALVNPEVYFTDKKVNQFKIDLSNVILWSGCTDREYSNDAWIDGRSRGAMTYAFFKIIRRKEIKGKDQRRNAEIYER